MVWKEIETASKENRREVVLVGKEISARLEKNDLDYSLFKLTNLNYLKISETSLSKLPDDIGKLVNLQNLSLDKNKIAVLSSKVSGLTKLKFLDLSYNELTSIPQELDNLLELNTLDVSFNKLESFPKLTKSSKLKVLKLRNNQLKSFPDICYPLLKDLTDLDLCNNEVEEIPLAINTLANLKFCLLKANKIQNIPAELADCGKLKDLDLKENPLIDKRLLQTIEKETIKNVLQYIKKNCKRATVVENKPKVIKMGKAKVVESNPKEDDRTISINRFDDIFCIKVTSNVNNVRQYIVACIVSDLKFKPETFRQFIKLQTKLHDEDCMKRTKATIATHSLNVLTGEPLTYTALKPELLKIIPLHEKQEVSGTALVKKLNDVADEERKEKKRNKYTGVHKYLYLLDDLKEYPVLMSANKTVISFPPITNSDTTKISLDTKDILIEVTSSVSLLCCKTVIDKLLKSMTEIFGDITVQQVRIVNESDGNFILIYPSMTDLLVKEDEDIFIHRHQKE